MCLHLPSWIDLFLSLPTRYHRLRECAISYISRNYSKPAIQEALPRIIKKLVEGKLPHAGETLQSLLGLRVPVIPAHPAVGVQPPRTTRPIWRRQTAAAQWSGSVVSPDSGSYTSGIGWGSSRGGNPSTGWGSSMTYLFSQLPPDGET